ncbi:MAG: ParB/RepB/Spo0J family partition protein [Acidaminococcaceae bacterium]
MSKRLALGKGLGAFFDKPLEEQLEVHAEESKTEIELKDLVPNPYQPRKSFDPAKLKELVASIEEHGIIQPLIVRQAGEQYEIVAGERRWRAAKAAGLTKVPVVIRVYEEAAMMEVAMIENIQRHNLNPLEEAEGIKAIMDKLGMTQVEVAKKLGRSRTAVANILRLLNLPPAIRKYVLEEKLTLGQVRPLLVITDQEQQLKLAQAICANDWSARTIEEIVNDYKAGRPVSVLREKVEILSSHPEAKAGKAKPAKATGLPELDCTEFQNKLQLLLGTKVRVTPKTAATGKIEIDYYSAEDLERLYELLEGRQVTSGITKELRTSKLTV